MVKPFATLSFVTTAIFLTQTTFKLGDRAYTLDGCNVCKRRKGAVYVGKVVRVNGDVVAVRLRRPGVVKAGDMCFITPKGTTNVPTGELPVGRFITMKELP